MPSKVFDTTTATWRVRFHLPAEANAERAWLAGEFNDWSTDACPLERHDDGSLVVSLPLEGGRSYRFRYYLGDGAWENDWDADAYVENAHGGSDSVVTVPPAPGENDGPPPVAAEGVDVGASARPAKKAAAKKKVAAKKAAAKKTATKATAKKSAAKKKQA